MDIIKFQDSQYSHFFQQVILDNETFKLYLDWNTRAECWIIRINTVSDESLISGVKLVLNYNLLTRYVDSGMPKGHLYAVDTSEKLEKIGRYDMDNIVFLTYLEESEIESL